MTKNKIILETYLKLLNENKSHLINEQITEVALYLLYKKLQEKLNKCNRACIMIPDIRLKTTCNFKCDISRLTNETEELKKLNNKTTNPIMKKIFTTKLQLAVRKLGVLTGRLKKLNLSSIKNAAIGFFKKHGSTLAKIR